MKKKLVSGLLVFVALFAITGCGSKKEVVEKKNNEEVKESLTEEESAKTENEEVKEALTKEDIAKIEKDYLDSDNLFSIDSFSGLSTTEITACGKASKGSFNRYDVIEYIDNKGDLKKGVISYVSTDKEMTAGSSGGISLQGVKEDTIKNSSILFKRENYNGIMISVQSDISDSIKDKSTLKVNIDGKDYDTDLVAYHVNDDIYWTYVSVLFNDEIEVSRENEIKIIDANADGKFYQALK